jgi:TolA-binding protein
VPKATPPAVTRRAPPIRSAEPAPDLAPQVDALALYRAAHRLHFSGGDPSAALAAWDAYLREDPSGAFAPEARYNRGICLVRLGRAAEARNALEPFANGAFGAYRKNEARALLDVLDGKE